MTTTANNQEFIDSLGSDTKLWSPSTKKEAAPSEVLANKVVLLYFSASWCGPCRRFTPILIELYNKLKARDGTEDFEVVFCSMDKTDEEYTGYTNKMPWWCLPHKSSVMGKLANQYGAQGIPHLVILDKDGSVLQADGVGEVSMDQEGTKFPWRPKPLIELLPSTFIDQAGTIHQMSELDNKYLMLYASAHWCPPCKRFTPLLCKAYTTLKEKRDDFELLFMSSDRDKAAFDEYFGSMTFCAIPYEERQAKNDIASRLGIRGIPALIMLGPKPADGTSDRPIINQNVRGIIETGDYLSDFPYQPKPYGDLNKTADNINALKCVIVFHEGGDDDEQEDIQEALQMASAACDDKNMRFFWANAPSGLSQTVRGALKLPPPGPDPVMVLLDIPDGGSFYVSSAKEMTMESIQAFVREPGEKKSL